MSFADGDCSSGRQTRLERDMLGEMILPADALYGTHTARVMNTFRIAGRPVHRELLHAYGAVKFACSRVSRELGVWGNTAKADAIERACFEMSEGGLDEPFLGDALQGGTGTSINSVERGLL